MGKGLLVACAGAALAGCDASAVLLSSTVATLPWQPPEATTILTVTFDDGMDSQVAAARILEGGAGIAAEDSFRGTFFIVSGALRRPGDAAGRLTAEDVQALAAAGHEISGHTVSHVDLAALAAADPYELRRQICNDRRALTALGTAPLGFAYPFSLDDGAHDTVADCGYAYARDAEGLVLPPLPGPHAETVPPLDRLRIRTVPSVSAAAPPGDVRHEASRASSVAAWLEHVRDHEGGGWVVLVLHHIRAGCGSLAYCMEESELCALVDWLRTRPPGIAVRTMQQVMTGDALVANPSLEQMNPSSSPVRPLCWKRIGLGSNFPSIGQPGPGRTGAYAEILRPTASVATPMIQIDPAGRGCPVPVTAGRRYEVRAFARAVGGSGQALASLVASTQVAGQWQAAQVAPPQAISPGWTSLSYVTAPAPVGATAMVFGVQYAGASGAASDLHIDDLSIVER
jgi:peptidoglycan/xylan/chitin deacetylase (PgdA/CDA1 family)